MHADVLAQKQRDELQVDSHQTVSQMLAPAFCNSLNPFPHPFLVRLIFLPAVEVKQPSYLLRNCEIQQIAGIGNADLLERVKKRLGCERTDQPLSVRRR